MKVGVDDLSLSGYHLTNLDPQLSKNKLAGWKPLSPAGALQLCPGALRANSRHSGTKPYVGLVTLLNGKHICRRAFGRLSRLSEVQGLSVSPREVLHTLLEPKLRPKPGEPDLVIVRVLAKGRKNGHTAQVQLDLIDRYDEATGLTAMQRATGWDASIKTIMNAQRVTPRGVNPAEIAVPGPRYVAELRKRGFSLTETFTTVKP